MARFFSSHLPSLVSFLRQQTVAGLRRLWRKMGRKGPFNYVLTPSILPAFVYWLLYEPDAEAIRSGLSEDKCARLRSLITPEALDYATAQSAAYLEALRLDPALEAELHELMPGRVVPMLHLQSCLLLLDAELGLGSAEEDLGRALQSLERAGKTESAEALRSIGKRLEMEAAWREALCELQRAEELGDLEDGGGWRAVPMRAAVPVAGLLTRDEAEACGEVWHILSGFRGRESGRGSSGAGGGHAPVGEVVCPAGGQAMCSSLGPNQDDT